MAIGLEIMTGMISSIIYDGVKRPVKDFSDLASRRRAMNKAFATGVVQAPPVDEASRRATIRDLVQMLGNDHNLFSEHVAAFIAEIDRSSIPDAMKQLALCGQSLESCYGPFELIYIAHDPLPFQCREIFAAISEAILTRTAQAVSDPALFEATKAQSNQLIARMESLASCLKNAKLPTQPLEAKHIDEIKLKIARGIEGANKQVNVETTQGTKRVAINKLVIPARLARQSSAAGIPLPHRDARQHDAEGAINYVTFKKSFNRAVILGDPGGGKSTLTQLLCHGLANQIVLESTARFNPQFDSQELRLPLRVIIRGLEKRQRNNPSYSIFDYLVDEVVLYSDNDREVAQRFLSYILNTGQAALLFDGLDEVLDVSTRRSMTDLIEKFTDVYGSCPSLVTSRIVGYSDAPLSEDYTIYTLARFNAEEVKKFSEQLIRAVSSLKVSEASVLAGKFLLQTETVAADLRENPLLLGLMVYIFSVQGEVPNNRPEIYKACALLMFEKWDQRRDIIFQFPVDFDLLDLFGHLALRIFGSAETEDGVSEDWLQAELRSFFDSWYEDRAKSVAAARILLTFITGRAWVMCEVGPSVFKFTHRTFLEYFFARRIDEEADGVGSLISNTLLPKIEAAQWDVVSHLALQIATFRSAPKSIQASDVLLHLGKETKPGPKEETNFLTFLSRSLDYLTLPEKNLKAISEHIFRRSIALGSAYNVQSIEIVHELLKSTKRRGALISSQLLDLARPLIEGKESRERTFCLYLIGCQHAGFRFLQTGTVNRDSELIWNSFKSLRGHAKKDQAKRARSSLEEAKSFLVVYQTGYLELYKRYRLSLLSTQASPLVPFTLSELAPLLVAETIAISAPRILPRFGGVSLKKEEASELVALIADDMFAQFRGVTAEVMHPHMTIAPEPGLMEEILYHFRHSIGQPGNRRADVEALGNGLVCYLVLALWSRRDVVQVENQRAGADYIETIAAEFLRAETKMPEKTRERLQELSSALSFRLKKPALRRMAAVEIVA